MKIDQVYMALALKEAQRAFDEDEVPVGAVITYKDQVIGRAHNQIRLLKDPTAHAEMIALTQAANFLKSERLINCTLYATIEPCSMCAGALVLARIKRLVFGASDEKTGACGSVVNIAEHKKLNHHVSVTRGVFADECGSLLSLFFKQQRALGKK